MTSLNWRKDADGYRLADGQKGRVVVGCSGRFKSFAPPLLTQARPLHVIFSTVRTEDDVLDFISDFGPLTKAGFGKRTGEVVNEVLRESRAMREFFGCFPPPSEAERKRTGQSQRLKMRSIGLNARLEAEPFAENFRLVLEPADLLNALRMQAAENIAQGARFVACAECGEFFEVGGPTSRRMDSRFCSDEHRVASFKKKQRGG